MFLQNVPAHLFWPWTQKNGKLFFSWQQKLDPHLLQWHITVSPTWSPDPCQKEWTLEIPIIDPPPLSRWPAAMSHTHTPFLCHNMAFRWGVCNRLANKTLLNGWTELIINRREKISHIYDAGKVFETPSASMQIFKLIMYSSERDRQYLSKSHCIMYKLLYFNYSCVYIVLCLSVVFCSMFTLRATWINSEAKHTLKNYVSIIYITNLDNDGCYFSKLHALRKTDVK